MKKILCFMLCLLLLIAPASVARADDSAAADVVTVESLDVGFYALLPANIVNIVDGLYDAYRWGLVVAYGAVDGIVEMDYMNWVEWRQSVGLSVPSLTYSVDGSSVTMSVSNDAGLVWSMVYSDGTYSIDTDSMNALAREAHALVYANTKGFHWPRYSVRELYDAGLITTQQFSTLFAWTRTYWETRPYETMFFARQADGSGSIFAAHGHATVSDTLAVSGFRQSGDSANMYSVSDGSFGWARIGGFQYVNDAWQRLDFTKTYKLAANGTMGSKYDHWYWRIDAYNDRRAYVDNTCYSSLLLCPLDAVVDNVGDYAYVWKNNSDLTSYYGTDSDAKYILGWDDLRTPFAVTLNAVDWITDDSYYYHIENIKTAIDNGTSATDIRVATIKYYSSYDGEDDGTITDPDGTDPDDISPPDDYPDYGDGEDVTDGFLDSFLDSIGSVSVVEKINGLFQGLEGFWNWLPADIGEIIHLGILFIIQTWIVRMLIGR